MANEKKKRTKRKKCKRQASKLLREERLDVALLPSVRIKKLLCGKTEQKGTSSRQTAGHAHTDVIKARIWGKTDHV